MKPDSSDHVHIGTRNRSKNLWTMNLQDNCSLKVNYTNNAYTHKILTNLVTYLHQAAFSPVPSTWIKAIDTGFYATWTGLASNLVQKHLPKSIPTAKVHMRKAKINIRSTKPTPINLPSEQTNPDPAEMTNAKV